MKPIIVIGHAALDRLYRIHAFPKRPQKIRALEHIDAGGGMAANAAATIARLGGPVELWSRVGDDAVGAQILEHLTESGVSIEYVKVFEGRRSSTTAILVDDTGERLIVGERDHAMSLDTEWLPLDHVKTAGAVLSDLRWFEATRAAFEVARRAGVPTLIDGELGSGEHLADFVQLSDYAIFSAPALENLFPDMDDAERLARVIEKGPRHAGVTRGDRGYFWRGRSTGMHHQPAFKVPVVDTTGAGDAFHGGFTWASVNGLPEETCVRIGSAVAALSCQRLGARAGLPTRRELDAFLAEQGA